MSRPNGAREAAPGARPGQHRACLRAPPPRRPSTQRSGVPKSLASNRPSAQVPLEQIPAILCEQNDIVLLGVAAFHPGRADRHSGNGEANRLRPLSQQTVDSRCRNVALDHIASNLRRMARGQIPRNPETHLQGPQCRRVCHADLEASPPDVVDPAVAAAAIRILGHGNFRTRCGVAGRCEWKCCQQPEDYSARTEWCILRHLNSLG